VEEVFESILEQADNPVDPGILRQAEEVQANDMDRRPE